LTGDLKTGFKMGILYGVFEMWILIGDFERDFVWGLK